MKRIIFIAGVLLACNSMSAKEAINGNDDRITYIGRTYCSEGKVSFDWSGVKTVIDFYGTSLEMEYADSGCSYINIWVDEEPSALNSKTLKLQTLRKDITR